MKLMTKQLEERFRFKLSVSNMQLGGEGRNNKCEAYITCLLSHAGRDSRVEHLRHPGQGIVAKPTLELLKLQADIIAVFAPFTVDTGTIAAFTAAHDDPAIDAQLIEYVSTFVSRKTGEHFSPYIYTGIAPRDYLYKMMAGPFEPSTFSPAGAAVYQLDPFGTAAKKLKAWDLKP